MTDIHILARFVNVNGGDWRAIDLYLSLCKQSNVQLWSPCIPNQILLAQYPIKSIRPYQGEFPSGGTLYVVGAQAEIGHWYEYAEFEKIIVIHNLFSPDILFRGLQRLTLNGARTIEIKYASKMIRDTIGLPGEIAYPFPHPKRFHPLQREAPQDQFVIGRVSRDTISKHHFDDPDFYRKLSSHNVQIKIIGGTCLKPWLEDEKNISLLPEIPHIAIPQILNTFDCFYYRTSLSWREAFGIVVIEAMLCGLPVVCSRQGGYAEVIEHGVNGFLFETEEEAFEIIRNLQEDENLRWEIGRKAKLVC